MVRIGVDVDGVLADFNRSFIPRVIHTTGRDLFGSGYVPITWNYPESLGYTAEEVSLTWKLIKESRTFWAGLWGYPETLDAMTALAARIYAGDDVYFITARPGIDAKKQTERWLLDRFPWYSPPTPTVLISSRKDECVQALDLDIYIDDRWENAVDVGQCCPGCESYLLTRPWNDNKRVLTGHQVIRIDSVQAMLDRHVVESVAAPCFSNSGPCQ